MPKEIKRYMEIPLEIKDLDDEDSEVFKFQGYAATFGNIDLVNDKIEKGAFKKSIRKRTPKLLMGHNGFDAPLGKIVEIDEDEKGLFIKAEMPKTDARVRDVVMPQMKIGSLDSMSIGYTVKDFDTDGKENVRILKELEVHEISLVTFPANPKAQVTGMKAEFGVADVEDVCTRKEFEDLLKSTGLFSRKAITKLASQFQEKQSDSADDNKETEEQSESVDVKTDLKETFESIINLKNEVKNGS